MSLNRRQWLALSTMGAAALGGSTASAASAQTGDGIDAIVTRFMREFDIPGAGIAIVSPDGATFARGYGLRTLGEPAPVDIRTQFAIASNSKAFLAACLAILVDEGRLSWEDPVTRWLPEFRMHDPAATAMMTVRDMLVHRSGLPLGAGDLMIFPKTDHAPEDVLRGLAHLKPTRGFRAGYAYDNTLYIVAGLLLERVSGLNWDRFVTTRIFEPLGMVDAVSNVTQATGPNLAGRHGRLGPPVRGMGRLEVVAPSETPLVGPAGGIHVSLAGILPWLQVQLGRGALPDGRRLWSAAQAAEMWTPQTIVASGQGPSPEAPQRAVMQGYALGWGVTDYRGRRMLSHAGGLAGQVTRTTLLPDHGLAFVVFTNVEDGDAVSGLRYALLDHLIGAPAFDWAAVVRTTHDGLRQQVLEAVGTGDFAPPRGGQTLPLKGYAGRYRDPWYGDIVVGLKAGRLNIDFTRTPAFKGPLEPFGTDTFRTRFGRGLEDALVSFAVVDGGVRGVTMKALSPIADFSFDFHDLAFTPVG
jgi:CubicO group peptidase (beta-lactamase class C family)